MGICNILDRRVFMAYVAPLILTAGCATNKFTYPSEPGPRNPNPRAEVPYDKEDWEKTKAGIEKDIEETFKEFRRKKTPVKYETGLESYTRKYDAIAHQTLDLESGFGAVPADYKFVDDFIDKVLQWHKPKDKWNPDQTLRVLSSINKILTKENKFTYKKRVHLNTALKTGEIDCDTTCYLYLAVAEVLGIPLFAVESPEHMFVRYVGDEGYFNWECTNGEWKDNEYYIKKDKITKDSIDSGIFLRSLNKEQTLGVVHRIKGNAWMEKGNLEKSVEHFKKSYELDPEHPWNKHTLDHARFKTTKGKLELIWENNWPGILITGWLCLYFGSGLIRRIRRRKKSA